jgi:hypothetical protein
MVMAPGYAYLLAIKIQYYVTVFWLRDSLYRDTAPMPPTKILYRDSSLAPIKLVPQHAYLRLKLVPERQKLRRTLLAP